MHEREQRINDFLTRHGWRDALISPLAGDASNRRYFRLRQSGNTARAVLMDSPPERGEDVRPFLHIANYLCELGFSAPHVLARDEAHGLLILEDLGDDLFARILKRRPDLETTLYSVATDLLVRLHAQAPALGLEAYDPPLMTELSALAFDWYRFGATGVEDAQERAGFCELFEPILGEFASQADVLIQRDYHAENLIWLPERTGIAQVGLLDFQDAMLGHRAYDLVSLLQDARRDVPLDVEEAMVDRYIAATGAEQVAFRAAYRVLGVQRNLRILGVFARLCMRDGKTNYIDLIPRVWDHLQRDLSHPALAAVNTELSRSLPLPIPEVLNKLKSQCATIQHL